jgi:hypothetical protein
MANPPTPPPTPAVAPEQVDIAESLTKVLGDLATARREQNDLGRENIGLLGTEAENASQLVIALGALTAVAAAAAGEGSRLDDMLGGSLTSITNIAGRSLDVFDSLLETMGGMYNVASAAGSDLRREYQQIQEMLGGGFGEEADRSAAQAGALAEEAVTGMTSLYENFYRNIPGTQVAMFDLFEDQQELSQMYMSIANDNTRAVQFLRGDTTQMMQDVGIATKAMGIDIGEATSYIERSIDFTGQANTDMLREAMVVHKSTEQATGISSKIIATNTSQMMANVSRFGNMTQEEMAGVSAQLAQVGLDFQALNSVTGRFQNFETAAESAANLNAVLGMNLDAMEMTEMSFQDQGRQLQYWQNAMRESGVTTQYLRDNMAEAAVLADNSGFSIQQLMRLASGQMQDYDEILRMGQERRQQMADDPEIGGGEDLAGVNQTAALINQLDTDMTRMQRTLGKTAAEARKMFQDQAIRAGMANMQSEFAQMAESAERIGSSGVIVGGALARPAAEAFEEGPLKGVARAGADFEAQGTEELRDMADIFETRMVPIGTQAGRAMADSFQYRLLDSSRSATDEAGEMTGLLAGPLKELGILQEVLDAETSALGELTTGELGQLGGAINRRFFGVDGEMDTGFNREFDDLILGFENMAEDERFGEAGAEIIRNLIGMMNSELDDAGAKAESPAPFWVEQAQGWADGVLMMPKLIRDGLDAVGGTLIPADVVRATVESMRPVAQLGKSIEEDLAKLRDINVKIPQVEALNLAVTSKINEINTATSQIVDAINQPVRLDLRLNLELTDAGKGELIASMAEGSTTGNVRVLTESVVG